jgi:hypothetical protein
MAAAAAIAGIIGTGLQVMGSLQAGKAQQAALNFEAKQREAKAAEERAASQRTAIDKRHEGELVMSRQKALAAASGGGVVNPNILDLYGETAERAEYNAASEIYGGESRARGQIDQAAAARMKGKAAMKGSIFEAAGTGFSGLGKAFGSPVRSDFG